jgi:hypothetical protein
MLRSKRISVALSLAGYLLATTAVQALHDHSAHAHLCLGEVHAPGDDDASDEGHHSHRHPHGPAPCDDSCFACRLLAVKCVAPTTFAVVESVGVVCLVEEPVSPLCLPVRLTLPLSRGPPAQLG